MTVHFLSGFGYEARALGVVNRMQENPQDESSTYYKAQAYLDLAHNFKKKEYIERAFETANRITGYGQTRKMRVATELMALQDIPRALEMADLIPPTSEDQAMAFAIIAMIKKDRQLFLKAFGITEDSYRVDILERMAKVGFTAEAILFEAPFLSTTRLRVGEKG